MKIKQKIVNCDEDLIPSTSREEIVSAKDCERFLEFLNKTPITDNPIYAQSFSYYMGLVLGGGDLSVVKPILFDHYPRVFKYLDYWKNNHPHGWGYYRLGVKDSKKETLVLSTLYLRHFFDIRHL